ncbi:hypothetical protein N656DRAFT_742471 [Canariomyces notabilis]|uniref:Protein kinase domain-containing protein n=1 Tax=Canariomyces notabilis TaxID=2074819 RepID=A0AAN6QBG9_9PEZI|nr:hypothetical protein N656DRAFT_742471 [Canariomyces arenarius]
MEDDENDEIIKDIQFGFRRFQAPAKRIDEKRHVFLLDVPSSPIYRWLPSWTPQLVRSWLQRLLPEWFLPTSVILKERNPDRADSYENEIDTYRHLQSLQGTHIPRLFGEAAVYDHERTRSQISKRPIPAILLEHVDGKPLHSLPTEELENPCLVKQLEEIYRLFTKNGVVHGDPRLRNFLRVGDKVFAIDFELSSPPGDITNKHELETLKSEIRRRGTQPQKAKSVHPRPGRVLLINGSDVKQLGTANAIGAPEG